MNSTLDRLARTLLAPLALAAAACSSSPAAPPAGTGGSSTGTGTGGTAGALTVQTYTSAATGPIDIQVNSHIVMGPTEALVVDGQLLAADAQAVLAEVQASGRKLSAVFVTHAHPDHYAGLAVLVEAVPTVKVVTTPAVLGDFTASAPGTFQYLQSALGAAIADKLVTPTAITGSTLSVDGIPLQVLELPNAGESSHGAALVLPGGGLVSGDLVYDDVHLFLGECHASGWKENLTTVGAMGFTTVYPGHGKSPVTAAAFAATSAYVDGALPILEAAKDADAGTTDAGDGRVGIAVQQIQAAFPSYGSNYLLGYSTSTFLDTSKCP